MDEPIYGYPTRGDLLKDLYINEGLSISQISKRIGIGTTTIVRWMKEAGIQSRQRGGANATGKLAWTLHRINPRVLFALNNSQISDLTGASVSFIWKFKRGVQSIWSSVLSAQPQD